MTPTEKAQAVALMLMGRTATASVPIIAAAIRQAEDEKLDAAAVWFEKQSRLLRDELVRSDLPEVISEAFLEVIDGIPADIRSLKHKD